MRLLLLVYTVTAWFTGGVTRAARGGFVYGGADMMLTMGRGLQRVQTQREQDGRETLPGTTDSSIGRLHCATFCALKHTHSTHYPAIYLDSGLSFDGSLEVRTVKGEDLALQGGGGTVV